jgi:uncharacterized protein YprB with RNaseH-like and TPR domain
MPLRAPLEAARDAIAAALGQREPPLVSRLAFFDTETTGLSGGTGTYIFLAGLGWFEEGAFRLRQYFLPRIEDERAMLSQLSNDMARLEGGMVSYNGRAFDLPLLETRLTLSRLLDQRLDLPHFDLLRAVRRLYRHRMPGCSLGEAESRLLGVQRQNDVPGYAIPSIYFDYIRAGRVSPLRAVFRHNALDILSLAGVLAAVAGLFAREDLDPEDAIAIARWWELEGEPERAEPLYRSALPRLDAERDAAAWTRAASRYAMILKRGGTRCEAVPFWSRLWAQGDLDAGLELAKHLEHESRDLAAAEAVARRLLERWPQADPAGRREVEHRLGRVRRKRERSNAGSAQARCSLPSRREP